MSEHLTAVTDATFDKEVLKAAHPVLVDFWAPWCGPCRALTPTLETMAGTRKDVKIVKVNVDENPEIASRYGIMSIPTMLLFVEGQLKASKMGAVPKSEIETFLSTNI